MPGSRKGEKRGAAGRHRSSDLDAINALDSLEGIVNTGPKRTGRKPGRSDTANEQYYRDVTKFINGDTASQLEPREVMLKAMRWFEARAEEYVSMSRWLLGKLTELKTPEDFAAHDVQLQQVELRIRDYYNQAVDVAYKCAPFVHPRLSAVAMGGGDFGGPVQVIGMLLEEIEALNQGRPSWAPKEIELQAESVTYVQPKTGSSDPIPQR